jgi:hypothetical protein
VRTALRPRAPTTILVVSVAMSASLATVPAHADPKAVCLDAVAQGQTLRDAHKLVDARAKFQICASATCPAAVRGDCASWVGELDKAVPTIVLSAKDAAGDEVTDATVTIDEEPMALRLDGQAVTVDPGLHKFRFVRADGSVATRETLVKEGDKVKGVEAVFGSGAAPAPSSTRSSWGAMRIGSIAVGGAGVAALASGIGLAFAAKSADNAAKVDPSSMRLSASESAASEGNVATALVVAGSVLAATGLVLWFTAPKAKVSAAVGTHGRELLVEGRF